MERTNYKTESIYNKQGKLYLIKQEVRRLANHIFIANGPDLKSKITNCYNILINDEINAVIDTGAICNFESIFTRESVSTIVNSHYHMDHTRFNESFSNAKVWLHEADIPFLTDRNKMRQCLGLDRYGPEEAESIMNESSYVLKRVDFGYSNGQQFSFGKTTMVTIHAPGHTPGHSMLYFPAESILYSADIEFSKWGPGYGSPLSSIEDYFHSIDLVKEINPKIIISGHQGIMDGDFPKITNQYKDTILQREEVILNSLQDPRNMEELTDLKNIMPFYQSRYTRVFTMNMIELHIKRLLKQGRITTLEDGRYQKTHCK